MATYVPNDTNCTGWDGLDAARPAGSLAMDTEDVLSGGELDTISVDDSNDISYVGASGYSGHHIRFAIDETPALVTQITPTVKGWATSGFDPAQTAYYLYIWDDDGTAWEYMADHSTGSKDTLTDDVTVSITNYIHNIASVNYIDILLMGPLWSASGAKFIYTYYAKLDITASAPPPAASAHVMTTFLT